LLLKVIKHPLSKNIRVDAVIRFVYGLRIQSIIGATNLRLLHEVSSTDKVGILL
jgi:hypothetical protein